MICLVKFFLKIACLGIFFFGISQLKIDDIKLGTIAKNKLIEFQKKYGRDIQKKYSIKIKKKVAKHLKKFITTNLEEGINYNIKEKIEPSKNHEEFIIKKELEMDNNTLEKIL